MRPAFEVAELLNHYWDKANEQLRLNTWQWRTLHALRRCRTAELGGHIDRCDQCGYERISYNSCRNRHCPKCQGQQREAWMAARQADLLPVPYFHTVFTLPQEVNRICLHQPRVVYDLLFRTAWSTIQSFAADTRYLGGITGMIAILHTWGQTLSLHPHLHCIIPAGGITATHGWKFTRNHGKFLFPVKALSKVFQARFAAGLRKALPGESKEFFNSLFTKPWVVYAKRPFGGPLQVVEYLGRYTHKIAISNHRLTGIGNDTVSFTYKDYRQGGARKETSLEAVEFIRRFAQHILPKGLVRIRHYGILSSKRKADDLKIIRSQLHHPGMADQAPAGLAAPAPPKEQTCPCCKKGIMRHVMDFDFRGPPSMSLINRGWKEGMQSGIPKTAV